MAKKNTVMLIIMDGFGLSEKKEYNAVAQANLKVLSKLMQTYPHSYLEASAEAVGLPHGQIGNSEVGHLNIGAGRIVYQSLTKITNSSRKGDSCSTIRYCTCTSWCKYNAIYNRNN